MPHIQNQKFLPINLQKKATVLKYIGKCYENHKQHYRSINCWRQETGKYDNDDSTPCLKTTSIILHIELLTVHFVKDSSAILKDYHAPYISP